MKYFECDYMEGAHPLIMEKMMETNMEHTSGYGSDPYTISAKDKIRKECGCPNAQVHFLVGGTQTNAIMIKTLLRPYEGVFAVETGHVNVHEAGAIEAGGHKVITLPGEDGKMTAASVKEYMERWTRDDTNIHMVKPGMIYISHPTELGTLYTKKELQELRDVCTKYHILMYMDGARMGYGLMADDTDVTLKDIASLCDAFYIGGTKVGALFGEAVVIPNPDLVHGMFPIIKQEGALLAKGRLLGIQFDTLFTDGLYFKIAKHALDMAKKLKEGLKERGYRFYYESPTNQQYIVLKNEELDNFGKKVAYSFWEEVNENETAIRLVTSWATKEEDVEEFLLSLDEK